MRKVQIFVETPESGSQAVLYGVDFSLNEKRDPVQRFGRTGSGCHRVNSFIFQRAISHILPQLPFYLLFSPLPVTISFVHIRTFFAAQVQEYRIW